MTDVYVLVGAHDRVLYIGASRDVARRVAEHRTKPWWPEVVDVEVFPHDDWEAALSTERIGISALGPKYNLQHADPMAQALEGFRAGILNLFDEVSS